MILQRTRKSIASVFITLILFCLLSCNYHLGMPGHISIRFPDNMEEEISDFQDIITASSEFKINVEVEGAVSKSEEYVIDSVEQFNKYEIILKGLPASGSVDIYLSISWDDQILFKGEATKIRLRPGNIPANLVLHKQEVTAITYENLTVAEFIEKIGTAVEKITANKQPAGITVSEDGKTVNVSYVKLSGEFKTECRFPNTLVSADLSGIDTKDVTVMDCMFAACTKLEEVNLTKLNTSNVTSMKLMFMNTAVTTLNLASFDTSKTTSIMWMFAGNQQLTTIYVSDSFTTENITNKEELVFTSCKSLKGAIEYDGYKTTAEYANCEGYFTNINGHVHSWDEGTVTKEATMEETGEKTYTCTSCGAKKKTVIAKLKSVTFGGENFNYSYAKIGDIVLTDGSYISPQEYVKPAAVIIRAPEDGKPALGVGIYTTKAQWAATDSQGYSKNIPALYAENLQDNQKNAFNILKENCSDVETNKEYYPAWYYCYEYGTNHELGDFSSDWYMPSLAEVEIMKANKEKIEQSLSDAGGFHMSKIGSFDLSLYFASCNDVSTATNQFSSCAMANSNGSWSSTKNGKNTVCAVREFDFDSVEVGDIVLTDGSIIKNTSTYNKAAAIIFKTGNSTTPALGVGVHYSDDEYNLIRTAFTNMTELVGSIGTGLTDGSCSLDYFAKYFPETDTSNKGWQYVREYSLYNKQRKYERGWYLPTITELNTLYTNKSKVDESLAAIGISELSDLTFWSCNQMVENNSAENTDGVSRSYSLNFATGQAVAELKNEANHRIAAVHCFGGKKELQKLETAAIPSKELFYFGEEIDTTGMKINGVYKDGIVEDVTDKITIQGFSSDEESESTGILVEYLGKTVIVPVTVKYRYHCDNCGKGYILEAEKEGCVQKFNCPGFAFAEVTGFEDGTFYMGQTEITFAKWYDVYEWAISEKPQYKYTFSDAAVKMVNDTENHDYTNIFPVTSVSWQDAVIWCNAASEKEGLEPFYYNSSTYILRGTSFKISDIQVYQQADGYRLPYNIEWEYAAGGQTYTYSGSNTLGDVAWYAANSDSEIHAVKTKNPNGYGLYDMNGNVSEWCAHEFNDSSYYSRGGNYLSEESECSLTERQKETDSTGKQTHGLRVMRHGSTTYGTNVATRNYDYSTASAGDIVLKDGSFVPRNQYDVNKIGINTPVAVIFRKAEGANPALGIAIDYTAETYWCSKGSIAYDRTITVLQATYNEDGTFTSDYTCGSDSSLKLMNAVSDYNGTTSGSYPAWRFAKDFGTFRKYSVLKDGWYLPTIMELQDIYKAKSIITQGINKTGKAWLGGSFDIISCTQDAANKTNVFYLNFGTGIPTSVTKNTTGFAFVIREFGN